VTLLGMRWILLLAACGSATAEPPKCKAIFAQLAKLPAGVDAAHARKIVGDRAWLKQSDDEPVEVLGGHIPVEMTDADQVFVVRCLKQNEWAMYGRISGHSAKTFGAFLDGNNDVKLIEYSLVSPDGKIDHHK
jgi:hypothetical protein